MFSIKPVIDGAVKSAITDTVLRRLPQWFGIEKAVLDYVDKVRDTVFYAAGNGKETAGFISVKFNNRYTAEIYVMGVLRECHNMGMGKALIGAAEKYLRENDFKFLMVKTLGDSHPDAGYAATREFYRKSGFYPLEEIEEIWGKDNPCLIMVKQL